jgi:hypothetical protein
MNAPRYLWKPPRNEGLDECFAALGRALYLAQRYEDQVGEAALRANFDQMMKAEGNNAATKLARRLWARTLHEKIRDLPDEHGYQQRLLAEAKAERNYIAHEAALSIDAVARACSPKARLLARRRWLARLEHALLLMWFAYDDVAWINEAVACWPLPDIPNFEEQWHATRNWVSADFGRWVRDHDRRYVARLGRPPYVDDSA